MKLHPSTLSSLAPRIFALSLAALLALAGGCGDDGGGPMAGDDDDDIGPPDGGSAGDDDDDVGDDDDDIPCGEAFLAPSFDGIPRGYEGQQSWVVSLDARASDDDVENFSCAEVTVDVLSGPMLLTQKCNAARCGVVLTVADTQPNGSARPWPTLDAARGFFLAVNSSVAPIAAQARAEYSLLEEFNDTAGTDTLVAGPVRVVSRIGSPEGIQFKTVDDFALRLFSMSGGTFGATVDVSADGPDGGGGGFNGGFETARGSGPGGGGAGDVSNTGGGGGHRFAGDPNSAGGSEGGVAYAGPFGECLPNAFFDDCGGSGGGGQLGPGGGGGGVFAIIGLGPLNLTGARFLASGASAAEGTGGGGGAGGGVFVAAPSWDEPAEIDVGQGFGAINLDLGQEGGRGSEGIVRIDVPGESWPESLPGVAVDLPFEPADYLREDPAITLTGFAEPGSAVCATDLFLVEERDFPISQAMTCSRQLAGPDGRWSIDLRLRPGLNRFQVESGSDTGIATSWTGNSFRFEGFEFEEEEVFAPVAGLIDFVYVPDTEPLP